MDWSDRIGRRIRLRDLHILLAVVQCKSMSKAAEQFAISKPVISKVIADLEQLLGVRLIERDRHGAEPTIFGAALLKRGITIFDELRESVKELAYLADPGVGEIRIGAIPPLAASFVATVADQLARRHPRIVFHLIALSTDKLYDQLRERKLDLLIARRMGSLIDEQVTFEFLFDDRNVVGAGLENPWTRRRRIGLGDLVNESWTLPPLDSPPGAQAMEAFRASGLDYPSTIMFALDVDVRMALLATGRYLTIYTASAFQRPGLKVLPIELPTPRVAIGIISLKSRALSPVAKLFVEQAREMAKRSKKHSIMLTLARNGPCGMSAIWSLSEVKRALDNPR